MGKQDDAPVAWRKLLEEHALESQDPASWLRYGVALSQLMESDGQERRQQQQMGLAFAHAERLGASAQAVALSQSRSILLSLAAALELTEQLSEAALIRSKARRLETQVMRLLAKGDGRKPVLRTVHHFACTGGTVISKCLASMPHVALLSEVNPLNRFSKDFEPAHPLLMLERSYRELRLEEIEEEFLSQIGQAVKICASDGVDLVIRDHSHTDFCIGDAPAALTPICDFLGRDYILLSAITVRHPLDSYLGLLAQGWHTQLNPSTLDEYCRRYLRFLDRYEELPRMKYECFCQDPDGFLQGLCDVLDLDFSFGYRQRFGQVRLSGDSGRRSNSEIALRSRRPIPEAVALELQTSDSYRRLLERLHYE